ncbi:MULTISPECIES: SigE family RNA polymerase sigma factor [Nocardioides]|uniref:SigE family RNA polymerase sigma factor n=1 Tax=Nocardioides TaxID=1839 RepID=UPI00032DC6F2|nr:MULTISPECIES: SigE family RNA polymerase sigma factor [Nocardioides]EON25234.1 sigma-70, region 4 type 2 [Nocardioides sp. CF8]
MKPADEMAFVEFAQSTQPRLRRAAYLLCGDWDRAADHVQEGLIRVYVAWPKMRRSGGEHAYARKAVVSAFLDSARKRSSTEYATEADASVATGEDVAEAVTARRALVVALEKLPPRQRACVVLRYFEDLDVAATAAALGCSQGTVKSQTSRALDSLRSMFDESPTGELVILNEGTSSW